jgi:hypothetical protein
VPVTFTVPVTVAPPPVGLRVKLAVFSVEFVIASEKFADTEEFSATPVAAFAGNVADTIGGVVSGAAAVVNCQLKLAASALPAASFAAAVMVAVYCVLPARGADGVNVAVLPLTFTVPVTAAPPIVVASVKLAVVSVASVIGSENVADTEEFVATPVAAFAGNVADTVGAGGGGVSLWLSPPPLPLQAATVSRTIRPAIERTLR